MNVERRDQVRAAKSSPHAQRHGAGLVGAIARHLQSYLKPAPTPRAANGADNVAAVAPAPAPFVERRRARIPELFDRALNALQCPVVVVGPRRTVKHVNAEAQELFGDKVVGRNLALFFREPTALDALSEVLGSGGTHTLDVNLDVPIRRQYRLVITRLAQVPGEAPHAMLEFQETTLIKRSESMRSEFVANVSHELRSPLATLIGFIETMQVSSDDRGDVDIDAQRRFLGIMEGEAQRMSRMIDDLLSLTNVELREHERPREGVDLFGLMREVVDALVVRGQQRNVDIILDCPDDLKPVCGDRDQLIQVFHNLITNAIKYGASGDDGGRVEVIVHGAENGLPDGSESVQIRVRDYGDGIEPEHLPRLTERFYRIDKGRSRAMGGTGLGLAIVKHIVNRHRGRFLIESTLGEGSTFCVRLPVLKTDT